MSQLSITTVIPAYNGERYLAEAIESVLAQTRPSAQIIIVDDCSTDGTPQIAQSYDAVTYIRAEKKWWPFPCSQSGHRSCGAPHHCLAGRRRHLDAISS